MAVAATIDEHPGVRDDLHKGMRVASTSEVDRWRSGFSGESLRLNQWLARAGTAANPAAVRRLRPDGLLALDWLAIPAPLVVRTRR